VTRKMAVAATRPYDAATEEPDTRDRSRTLRVRCSSKNLPLLLNTLSQFAAFSGPSNELRQGGTERLRAREEKPECI